MGGSLSTTFAPPSWNDDHDWAEKQAACQQRVAFFSSWTVTDVEAVLDHYKPAAAAAAAATDATTAAATGIQQQSQPSPHAPWTRLRTQWREFFQAVHAAEDDRLHSSPQRTVWHPCTTGYAMCPAPGAAAELANWRAGRGPVPPPPPDFTDDEESDDEDGANDGAALEVAPPARGETSEAIQKQSGGDLPPPASAAATAPAAAAAAPQRPPPPLFDPALRSPVFFGYSTATVAAQRAQRRAAATAEAAAGDAMARRQRERARARVADMRADADRKREARVKKEAAAVEAAEAARRAREGELAAPRRTMGAAAWAEVRAELEGDAAASAAAEAAAIQEMRLRFATLNVEERRSVAAAQSAADEAERAESSPLPRGAPLEALARAELLRAVDRVEAAGDAAEAAQEELVAAWEQTGVSTSTKGDDGDDGGGGGGVNKAALQLLEGRARARRADLETQLAEMAEAEAVLTRARTLRAREEQVLPLFEAACGGDGSSSSSGGGGGGAPLVGAAIALLAAAKADLWVRIGAVVALFARGEWVAAAELAALLLECARVLRALGLWDGGDVCADGARSVALRAVAEAGVASAAAVSSSSSAQAAAAAAATAGLTQFEAKRWLVALVRRDRRLSEAFGAPWGAAEASALMRARTAPARQLELGLITLADLKYRLARDAARHRPQLDPERRLAVHDRALARGDGDPLKPDYSRFLAAARRACSSAAVPLAHGHLGSLPHWRARAAQRGATKLQNLWRGRRARAAAAAVARRRAFAAARAAALADARRRVEMDFRRREAEAAGVARMRWDAKVRVRQAKMRASGSAGDGVTRADALREMLEETAAAAEADVRRRFDEIARERGIEMETEDAAPPADGAAAAAAAGGEAAAAPAPAGGSVRATREARQLRSAAAAAAGAGDGMASLGETLAAAAAAQKAAVRTESCQQRVHMLQRGVQMLSARFFPSDDGQDLGKVETPRHAGDAGGTTANGGGGGETAVTDAGGAAAASVGSGALLATDALSPRSAGALSSVDSLDVMSAVEDTWAADARVQRNVLRNIGLFPAGLYTFGETAAERALRRALASPEPPMAALAARLRAWDPAVTQLRAEELLLELPSKRLLLRYVSRWLRARGDSASAAAAASIAVDPSAAPYAGAFVPGLGEPPPPDAVAALAGDLAAHFNIVRATPQLAAALAAVLASDAEAGVARRHAARALGAAADALLRAAAARDWREGLQRMRDECRRRSLLLGDGGGDGGAAADKLRTAAEELAKGEAARAKAVEEAQAGIAAQARKLRVAALELEDVRKRRAHAAAVMAGAAARSDDADGGDGGSGGAAGEVAAELRHDWVRRYGDAQAAPDSTPEETQIKYTELGNVCREFLAAARHAAITIVDELHLPVEAKSLQPAAQSEPAGRWLEGGRRRKLRFEAHNIRLKLCTDDDGVFDGSDEYAAKGRGGRERLGAAAYLQAAQAVTAAGPRSSRVKVIVPFVATIDYHGFRVLAVAKLPTERRSFTFEGKLRKAAEELVHGTRDGGSTFTADERPLNGALQDIAQQLNLARHLAKGAKELNPHTLWASADLRAYRGAAAGEYLLLNFWRALPPEDPQATPHLLPAPCGHTIFWRGLRPEALRRAGVAALSPDALSLATLNCADWEEQAARVSAVTKTIITEVLPAYAEELGSRMAALAEDPAYESYDAAMELHSRGIGLRHLGLLRNMFWRPLEGEVSVAANSTRVRTRADMRGILAPGDTLRIDGAAYRLSAAPGARHSATTLTLDAPVAGRSCNDAAVWKGSVATVSDDACARARALLLGEMVARTIKAAVRGALRARCEDGAPASRQAQAALAAAFLNAATGAAGAHAAEVMDEQVAPALAARFGACALDPPEAAALLQRAAPCARHVVRRVCQMLGVALAPPCAAAFAAHPVGFAFTPLDLCGDGGGSGGGGGAGDMARVKHNLPLLPLAEAVTLSLQAEAAARDTYAAAVRRDGALLYLPLQERRGSATAVNLGGGGGGAAAAAAAAAFAGAVEHQLGGPGVDGTHDCAVRLRPEGRGRIDTRHTAQLLAPMRAPPGEPFAFSVEAWARVRGAADVLRVVVNTGRYALAATRANRWSLSVTTEERVEVQAEGPPLAPGEWTHLAGVYDGALARLYVNGALEAELDVATAAARRTAELTEAVQRADAELAAEEAAAREAARSAADTKANAYFKTQEGKAKVSRAATKIIERAGVQAQLRAAAGGGGSGSGGAGGDSGDGGVNGGSAANAAEAAAVPSKGDARARARQEIKTEMYLQGVRAVAETFARRRHELRDARRLEREEAEESASRPLRVGATCGSHRSAEGRHFFPGDLCHVAAYRVPLSADAVRARWLRRERAPYASADRLFELAHARFEAALAAAGDGSSGAAVAARYAASIAESVALEVARGGGDLRRARCRVARAVAACARLRAADALAAIVAALPSDPTLAACAAAALDALLAIEPRYFDRRDAGAAAAAALPLDQLALLPRRFGMTEPGAPPALIVAAARAYRLVLSSSDARGLSAFGDGLNLAWVPRLRNDAAVVTLVAQAAAAEDPALAEHAIDLEAAADTLTDADLDVVAQARRLATVLNLAGCAGVSAAALCRAARALPRLRALTLDGCGGATDAALAELLAHAHALTALGLSRCGALSPAALAAAPRAAPRLRTLNLSHAPGVTDAVVAAVARGCRQLRSLFLQYCVFVTDAGVQALAAEAAAAAPACALTALDISGCVRMGDAAVAPVAEACAALTYLNLKGLDRVTEAGAGAVTHRLWRLAFASFEGLCLAEDAAFVHSVATDGRRAVEENMMRELTQLSVRDCVRLTDVTVEQIGKRCARLEMLDLSGCALLTDAACRALTRDPISNAERCRALTDLNLGYCTRVGDGGAAHLARAVPLLRRLNLAGCVGVSDAGVRALARGCPKLDALVLAQCALITDSSACALAEHVWLEELDVCHCTKLTDDGITVLSLEFAGLRTLDVSRCPHLTDRAIDALQANCPALRELWAAQCPRVSADALRRIAADLPLVTLHEGLKESHV